MEPRTALLEQPWNHKITKINEEAEQKTQRRREAIGRIHIGRLKNDKGHQIEWNWARRRGKGSGLIWKFDRFMLQTK